MGKKDKKDRRGYKERKVNNEKRDRKGDDSEHSDEDIEVEGHHAMVRGSVPKPADVPKTIDVPKASSPSPPATSPLGTPLEVRSSSQDSDEQENHDKYRTKLRSKHTLMPHRTCRV